MVMREWLKRSPLIAILRGIQTEEVESVCEALHAEGVYIVEIPLNSPNPFRTIRVAADLFGERMLVGAGTVTEGDEVGKVHDAGGRLIVCPGAFPDVVRRSKVLGMYSLPGIGTATEAFTMVREGADGLKLFPADALGVKTFTALRAVLPPQTLLVPVGGVDVDSIQQWQRLKVDGFGIGSSLYKPGRSVEDVQQIARRMMARLSGPSEDAPQST